MCEALQRIMTTDLHKAEERGKELGKEKAEASFSQLISKLLSLGRSQDVGKIASDREYREKLYAEFGIE